MSTAGREGRCENQGTRPGHGVLGVMARLPPTGLRHTRETDLGTEARHLVSFHCYYGPSRCPRAATLRSLGLRQPCIQLAVPHT